MECCLCGKQSFLFYPKFPLTRLRQLFELLTGEYLFDPQAQGGLFTKDDDHMAQIIELLGDFPLECKMGGKYSRDLFDQSGEYLFGFVAKELSNKRAYLYRFVAIYKITQALAS